MIKEHATFLKSLPIVLHIPHYHFYVVHAGLLPSDPRYPSTDSRQPLAHRPKRKTRIAADTDVLKKLQEAGEDEVTDLDLGDEDGVYRRPPRGIVILPNHDLLSPRSSGSIEEMRKWQEEAILRDIPQNRQWWNLVNMRGIRKDGEVTRYVQSPPTSFSSFR